MDSPINGKTIVCLFCFF